MSAGLIGLRLIGVDCNFYISIKLGGLDYKLCRILETKRLKIDRVGAAAGGLAHA